ncbi:MAG: hypothetical protein Q7T50_08820 [Candidatus Magasanikbacteria bacterium]|nr:hypothetical protein [Candidatus Magasanikbacteria bacterium]
MFIFVLAMSVFPRQVGEYIIVTILIAVMLIILNFIVKQRKMEKANIESVKNREIAQNDNSNAFKLNDPLMNRIAENAEIQINKKITRKKIKYISGIFIAMIIVFNIYPSIIKIKNNFTKMNKLNTGAANKARDLRGGQLAERLNINYDVHFAYPVDLNDELIKSSDEFFKEDRVDYKKDVLGKEIKLSDFNYKSSGKEFELCLNDGEYSKCWRGKDGRAF